ncbi:MAG TPA: hypothetical protein VIH99_01715 [Bdellovibrionota bacterium]|jgi:hypothetical protein
MGLISLLFLAFLPPPPALAQSGVWDRPWQNLTQLMAILQTVPEGRAVLEKAQRKDPRFADRVKFGAASFTESTFSRTYSLLDGKERIELRHDVTINKQLRLADAVVDLAHELVHYTEKGMLDPYRPGFELSQFVRNGIEGEGGELAAMKVECRLAWSLERKYKNFPPHRLCERYRGQGNAFQQEEARLDYYAVGSWLGQLSKSLRKAIPEIHGDGSIFTSSYASKPYPVALEEEYAMTRKAACANNRRKYRLIAAQSESDRKPAEASPKSLWEEQRRLKTYDRLYCRSIPGKN